MTTLPITYCLSTDNTAQQGEQGDSLLFTSICATFLGIPLTEQMRRMYGICRGMGEYTNIKVLHRMGQTFPLPLRRLSAWAPEPRWTVLTARMAHSTHVCGHNVLIYVKRSGVIYEKQTESHCCLRKQSYLCIVKRNKRRDTATA